MFDLNCDLGEGIGNDHKIMPWITSCNIACGGHFGNIKTISETISLAKKHNVRVGAHPSYYDHKNFVRKKFLKMSVNYPMIKVVLGWKLNV